MIFDNKKNTIPCLLAEGRKKKKRIYKHEQFRLISYLPNPWKSSKSET